LRGQESLASFERDEDLNMGSASAPANVRGAFTADISRAANGAVGNSAAANRADRN
jgi:hypothetical protein